MSDSLNPFKDTEKGKKERISKKSNQSIDKVTTK